MKQWHRFSDPDFGVTFSFPDSSPAGYEIKRKLWKTGEMNRIHLSSPESSELYFELTCYLKELDPERGRKMLVDENRQRFQNFNATPLEESSAAPVPAQSFTFSWREAARHVLFFDFNKLTYRIIFDPQSQLNHQILSTVKLN